MRKHEPRGVGDVFKFLQRICRKALAENFIDDGSMLRIVDFELAGNDEPCFEPGNMATDFESMGT